MTDTTSEMLIESLQRLLGAETADAASIPAPGQWHEALWRQMATLGMTSMATDYQDEGLALAAGALSETGRFGAVVPLLEHDLLAGWLLAQAGLEVPAGKLLGAAILQAGGPLTLRRGGGQWRLDGSLPRVAFGRHCDEIVLAFAIDGAPWILRLPRITAAVSEGRNMADEPRDLLRFDNLSLPEAAAAPLPPHLHPEAVLARAALGRAFQMLGAMERAFALSHDYAQARVQFGRPLSQFQMIQNYLAEIMGEICATRAICELALQAGRLEEIAVAKIRAGQAARIVAERSHQIHGAIGFTREYALQLATRRLWSWREEFGNEAFWADRLARSMAAIGADGLWARLTG